MHKPGMGIGVGAYERGCQTTYTVRRLDYLDVMLSTWSRGEVVSHS